MPPMAWDIVLLLAGFTIIYVGAEYLVYGSVSMSLILGVNPVVIGLTVVAFGTSLPELMVCLVAVFRQSNEIAVGNVIGSNIANIGLVLATGAALFNVTFQRRTFVRDVPFMLLFSFVLAGMCYDGLLSRMEGAILAAGLVVFTIYCVKTATREDEQLEVELKPESTGREGKLWWQFLVTCGGIAGVLAGAHLLVESAISIARDLHVSEFVIGMTIVAVGTSLPEMATTIVAAYRKQSDIAVGNVIGSNIFNVGFVIGATSLAKPLPVERSAVTGEMVVMLAFCLAVVPAAARGKMGRIMGAALLSLYAAFIMWQTGLF